MTGQEGTTDEAVDKPGGTPVSMRPTEFGTCIENGKGSLGSERSIEEPSVDIELIPSRDVPVAGELWSISGELHNRGNAPVWVVDDKTRLTLAPELYGHTSSTGSIGAFFPTSVRTGEDEVMRIDPGAKYSVVWKIDPVSERGSPGSEKPTYKRVLNSMKSYAFFDPGSFWVSATVHMWPNKPTFNGDLKVDNLGNSFAKTESTQVYMEASPWVLILGASIGGLLCFILQLLAGSSDVNMTSLAFAQQILVGVSSAIILSAVVTVLLSRLASTDFLIMVKVKDLWGAIATGFVIQWFGYPLLFNLL